VLDQPPRQHRIVRKFYESDIQKGIEAAKRFPFPANIPIGDPGLPTYVPAMSEQQLETRKPWERMPQESAFWFRQFTRYLLQPDEYRTVLSAYKLYREARARKHKEALVALKRGEKRVPPEWAEAAMRFRWIERSLAWDESEADLMRQTFEHDRIKERVLRIKILRDFRHKVVDAIEMLNPGDMQWREAMAGLRMVTEQLRTEFGDNPAQRVEHTGPEGGPMLHAHLVGITELSDEDLDERISRLLTTERQLAGAGSSS